MHNMEMLNMACLAAAKKASSKYVPSFLPPAVANISSPAAVKPEVRMYFIPTILHGIAGIESLDAHELLH